MIVRSMSSSGCDQMSNCSNRKRTSLHSSMTPISHASVIKAAHWSKVNQEGGLKGGEVTGFFSLLQLHLGCEGRFHNFVIRKNFLPCESFPHCNIAHIEIDDPLGFPASGVVILRDIVMVATKDGGNLHNTCFSRDLIPITGPKKPFPMPAPSLPQLMQPYCMLMRMILTRSAIARESQSVTNFDSNSLAKSPPVTKKQPRCVSWFDRNGNSTSSSFATNWLHIVSPIAQEFQSSMDSDPRVSWCSHFLNKQSVWPTLKVHVTHQWNEAPHADLPTYIDIPRR